MGCASRRGCARVGRPEDRRAGRTGSAVLGRALGPTGARATTARRAAPRSLEHSVGGAAVERAAGGA